jgi:retron-type reverse transcriptase
MTNDEMPKGQNTEHGTRNTGHETRDTLYESLCHWENLRLAHHYASRGKRGKHAAAAFEYRLADKLLALEDELRTQSYRPGPYTSFYIHEPKRRLISAAPFRDRVVHHALCNVIEPPFERSFIHDSYANRRGKGTHRALDRAQAFSRRYRYVLQCDVEQFFPAIDHQILRDTLARKISDPGVLWLVDRILESGVGVLAEEYRMRYFPADYPLTGRCGELVEPSGQGLWAALRPRGLPIGNLTSQFWANCFLNPFDHFVKRELRCPAYQRYVDDFLLFADHKTTLWAWRDALVERLARLRLTIHPGAHPRPTGEGFPFLGFVVYPTHRRLKRRNVIAYRRKLKRLVARWIAFECTQESVVASLLGWINHARYGDTWGLRARMVALVPPMYRSRPVLRDSCRAIW